MDNNYLADIHKIPVGILGHWDEITNGRAIITPISGLIGLFGYKCIM